MSLLYPSTIMIVACLPGPGRTTFARITAPSLIVTPTLHIVIAGAPLTCGLAAASAGVSATAAAAIVAVRTASA